LLDATSEQLILNHAELARFVETGAWEPTICNRDVSKLFLVAKPGIDEWRSMVHERHLKSLCVRKWLHWSHN
jgi:hypothetical protein